MSETTITINLTHSEEGWVASVTEMQGCITQGDDLHDVLHMVEDAMRGWADIEINYGNSTNPAAEVVDADSKRIHPAAPTLYRYMIVYNVYDNAFNSPRGEGVSELETSTRIMSFSDLERIGAIMRKIPAGTHAQVTNYKLMAVQQNEIWVPA